MGAEGGRGLELAVDKEDEEKGDDSGLDSGVSG